MISNELLEQIIYLSEKGILVDKNLINHIVLDEINNSDYITKDIFSGLTFEKIYEKDIMCLCNTLKGIITVDLNKLYKYHRRTENVLYTNLQIVRYVLHELEHLKEKYKSTKDDTIKLLLDISNPDIMYDIYKSKLLSKKRKDKKVDKLYFKLYNFIPGERIADIDSSLKILKSVKSYPKNLNIHKKLEKDYINNLYSGYIKVFKGNMFNVPLEDYLYNINQEKYLYDFKFYSSDKKEFYDNVTKLYSIEDKMRFGLPITIDESKVISSRNR